MTQFSINVSMKKSAIHSQPVDILRRNPDVVPRLTSLYRTMPLIQYQLINRSKEYTMASVHNKLQCCLLLPRTPQNKAKHQNQHTHEIQDEDGRSTVGVNTKTIRPTVSANPHLPKEDRRVRQLKLSSFCQSFKIALHYLLQ